MPRINTYSDNASIENDDKLLTYDTHGTATKLTAFSTIWNWIVSKLHALTSSSAALTPSTDRVLMDKNGTMTRVEPAAVAKYGIETYNGSTIAGSAQTVKSALDTLNSKTEVTITAAEGVVMSSTSRAYITGTNIAIYAKGRVTTNIINQNLFTFGGNKNIISAITFPIGIGSEWDITSIGYGFASGKAVVGRVNEGQWFHVNIFIPFA